MPEIPPELRGVPPEDDFDSGLDHGAGAEPASGGVAPDDGEPSGDD